MVGAQAGVGGRGWRGGGSCGDMTYASPKDAEAGSRGRIAHDQRVVGIGRQSLKVLAIAVVDAVEDDVLAGAQWRLQHVDAERAAQARRVEDNGIEASRLTGGSERAQRGCQAVDE